MRGPGRGFYRDQPIIFPLGIRDQLECMKREGRDAMPGTGGAEGKVFHCGRIDDFLVEAPAAFGGKAADGLDAKAKRPQGREPAERLPEVPAPPTAEGTA